MERFGGLGRIDGDIFDRRLVLLLQDFVIADEEIDQRQWLRRTVDLLSALVLLRATLLTRMTGDAGIPGQQMAVVPVGRMGTEEFATSLSEAVGHFLHTGTIYLYDPRTPEDFGLIRNAVEGVQRFFGAFHRDVRLRKDQETIMRESTLRRIVEQVTARHALLFAPSEMPSLPPPLHCVGPIWLERLTGTDSDESFSFQALTPQERAQLGELGRQLAVMGDAWREFPLTLTWSARDLARIIERGEGLQTRSFRAG